MKAARPLVVAAGLVAAALVAPLPAVADHVHEATAPIQGVTLRLKDYATATVIDCDATTPQVFPFRAVRIEADVATAGAPSEHWMTKLEVFSDTGSRFPGRLHNEWSAIWRHQNVPPHPVPGVDRWEVVQSNDKQLTPGLWRVVITVTGDMSGLTFTDTCTFQAVPPG